MEPSPAPRTLSGRHPNAPVRRVVLAYLLGVAAAGWLGGAIGWGLVDVSCADGPLLGERIVAEVFEGYRPPDRSCDALALGGAAVGTLATSTGAGVVAVLMMRAQSEWRTHPPRRRRDGR